jgi:hypothetical protein
MSIKFLESQRMHHSTFVIFHIIAISAMATLSGCKTTPLIPDQVQITTVQDRFDGPGGAGIHDFVSASNICHRESSLVHQNNAAPLIPSCNSIMRCLAGKGYVSSPSGKFDTEELRIGATCTPP